MIDGEVLRLRRLRNKALEVRAIARALGATRALRDEPVLEAAACAAWRIARTASGRLKAHPYLSYQRGPGAVDVLGFEWAGGTARATSFGRSAGLRRIARELRKLGRDLDDARALTLTLDLSDSFARFQAELRAALGVVEAEVGSTERGVRRAAPAALARATLDGDWPYLAF